MDKKILGLDLGTNSIGWALVEQNFENKTGKILGLGTRVIPMSQEILGEFGKGNSVSQTAERTNFRSIRRLRERQLLRRERLHRVLNLLKFLPDHYANQIDFINKKGQFFENLEPKIAYHQNQFIFKNSFYEMLNEFKIVNKNSISIKGKEKLVPYDWTIYYLRKKALTQKIEKQELAWILLNFNQKRGYYQLRGEEEDEIENKLVEFHSLKIVEVSIETESRKGTDPWYTLRLENGWIYRRQSKIPLFDWKDKIKDFIVTTELNDDGNIKLDKEGKEKRSFRAPAENDWTLLKKKTEKDLIKSNKTVGQFIFDNLLENPKQKIKGKLIRTIERKFYKDELKKIIQKQTEFHSELSNAKLLNDCVQELYANNEIHHKSLIAKDFIHLFINDIIFYQRPLKSQKSNIGNCSLEFRKFKDENGNDRIQYLKAIPKSHPHFQELRIWQWIQNLSIYKKENDLAVTADLLNTVNDIEALFEFLKNRKDVEQKALIKFLLERRGLKGRELNTETEKYRWNYVEDKKYPAGETRNLILTRLSKIVKNAEEFLTNEIELKLWHLIYSVTDKQEYELALRKFASKHSLNPKDFVDEFIKFPPFKSEYGSFSEKAIKKLLPLMRLGKFWKWGNIDIKVRDRIEKILNGEFDESIKNRVREKAIHLTNQNEFQGLPLWLAQYIIYNRYSEASNNDKWNSLEDLDNYLKEFKQHSLRNPIVEQVVTETLRVIKDIWIKFGNGKKDFFNEIHIELGREMKNTAEERLKLTNQVTQNENTNQRIRALLAELKNDTAIENVRPYSPSQQEILKIYEEGALVATQEIEDDILKISKNPQPSSAELKRYKLWLEQKYRSPYTGEIIPLTKLFTHEYEIEHIIPQSRFYDDSQSNKIICESAVNKLKDNQLGFEFIKNHHGEKILIGNRTVQILEVDAYEDFVKKNYSKNRSKRIKLLLEEIPDQMIERQLNDTRYISKFVSQVLSNIVRSETNDDGLNSKNLIPGNGKITNELKKDWGLHDVWNDLILPRFERLNNITNSKNFTSWNDNHQKFLPTVPIEQAKGFNKKRIDHRHHAMDALVIACATRDHVNYLNNKSAKSKERFDLTRKLRKFEKTIYKDAKSEEKIEREIPKEFLKPWPTFTIDCKNALEKVIVSFKQNLRVINKANNQYQKWINKNGLKTKEFIKQEGTNWAIRKPLHKDTVFGLISLQNKKIVSFQNAIEQVQNIVNKELRREILNLIAEGKDKKTIVKYFKEKDFNLNGIDVSKIETYYWDNELVANRVSLDGTFDESKIDSITDSGIRKIVSNHLLKYKDRKDDNGKNIPAQLLAFSPEGIEELNKNIVSLNNNKPHQPIYKVRTYETKGNKFPVGQAGNKSKKYVEAAKGTNLFFGIYVNESGKRSYETIPLNLVIERQIQGLSPVPEINDNGDKLLFHLSPSDLVYIPNKLDNIDSKLKIDEIEADRIYKVVSFTNNRLYVIPFSVAKSIIDKVEFSQLNKVETSLDGYSIKEYCIKIQANRIGYIVSNSQMKPA